MYWFHVPPVPCSVDQEAELPAADAAAAAEQRRPQRLPSTHKQPLVWVDLEMTGACMPKSTETIDLSKYAVLLVNFGFCPSASSVLQVLTCKETK